MVKKLATISAWLLFCATLVFAGLEWFGFAQLTLWACVFVAIFQTFLPKPTSDQHKGAKIDGEEFRMAIPFVGGIGGGR